MMNYKFPASSFKIYKFKILNNLFIPTPILFSSSRRKNLPQEET